MTIHACATADAGDLSMFETTLGDNGGILAVSSAWARTGSKSFVFYTTTIKSTPMAVWVLSAPANVEQYAKVAIWPRTAGYYDNSFKMHFLAWFEGATRHLSIAYDPA